MIPDREKILKVRSDIQNEGNAEWARVIDILKPGECIKPIKLEIVLIDQLRIDETLDKKPVDFFTEQLFQATGLTGISKKGCFTRLVNVMKNCGNIELDGVRRHIYIRDVRYLLTLKEKRLLNIPQMGRTTLDVMDRMLAACGLYRDEKRQPPEE